MLDIILYQQTGLVLLILWGRARICPRCSTWTRCYRINASPTGSELFALICCIKHWASNFLHQGLLNEHKLHHGPPVDKITVEIHKEGTKELYFCSQCTLKFGPMVWIFAKFIEKKVPKKTSPRKIKVKKVLEKKVCDRSVIDLWPVFFSLHVCACATLAEKGEASIMINFFVCEQSII